MEETSINQETMEEALLKALQNLFPSLGATGDPATEFYNKFQRAADDHDQGFIKRYDDDLNTTLIFAGLFSAVTSAFIIDAQSKLEPDFEEMNHTLLKIVASAALGNVPTGADATLPEWKGPGSTIVHVQAILYASLSTTLLAAFVAMLGKQWLNRYASVERGSVIDRCRQRKGRMDGMMTWKFGLVMECLPLMLQAALLLLGYALSDYLLSINRAVASVVIGFLTFGLLFYFLIISAATLSYNCPFQTPLSLILRYFIHLDNQRGGYLEQSKKWFGHMLAQIKRQQRQKSGDPDGSGISSASNRNGLGEHIELNVTDPPRIFDRETNRDWDGYLADSDCIVWMLEMPMDIDVTAAMARFIPEITWNAATRTIPLEKVYDALFKCFDHSFKHPMVKPSLRDHCYFIAKALIHVAIQRNCIGEESDKVTFESIVARHPIMGSGYYEANSDLEVTLRIIDHLFGDPGPRRWRNFTFTIPHHAWLGHILLYRAWDILRRGEPLPDYIKEFILYSLRLDPSPPATIIADCLFIVNLVLGIKLHIDDLFVTDKSHEIDPQIDRIYKTLTETFRNSSPTIDQIDRALESMELIASLSEDPVAQKSYELFHVVMQAPVSPTYSQEKKWKASRFAMHAAYRGDEFLPSFKDPCDILTFLDHHFDLATMGNKNQNEPIQNALRALAYASEPVAIEALERFDPTKHSFASGICYAFHHHRPFELRKAALFFLPLIGDRLFNTPHPIMKPDQMKSLCQGWASTVDDMVLSSYVQEAALAALFWMINSPHWRPHIVTDKWKLLEYFPSVPGNSQPLRRCLNNPELMDAIRDVANPAAMGLWMKILWLKYKELVPEVQKQLETVTKEIAQGRRRAELETYQAGIESELMKAEDALTRCTTSSTERAAVALRTKIENLQHAKHALVALKKG